MKLHDLPDDILIPIFALSDLPTLLSLRLTSPPTRAVIDTYIRTIAPSVARNSFPPSLLHLHPHSHFHSHHPGPSLPWLIALVPAHLSALTLDKDKLRRYPYITAGFPYGIPYASPCDEAQHWRRRIANGWRVLRRFHLVSERVYRMRAEELHGGAGRPRALSRVSSGVRGNRVWQAVSCPYTACTEHGVMGIFEGKGGGRRGSAFGVVEETRRREGIVLKGRLEVLGGLGDQDLLDYVYLWRLLVWVFRPYRRPGEEGVARGGGDGGGGGGPNWQAVIGDISMGCSWLNWYVLHVGTAPFWDQWWGLDASSDSSSSSAPTHHVRDMVHAAWSARTHHHIEVEREYVSKFEFALRKRCLTPDRLKRLEAEVMKGRPVKTISLDCIPWGYDQHCIVNRPSTEFPWYEPGEWIWMDRDFWLRTKMGRGWGRTGQLQVSVVISKGRPGEFTAGVEDDWDREEEEEEAIRRGELRNVNFLVYLGMSEAAQVWTGSGDADLFLPRY